LPLVKTQLFLPFEQTISIFGTGTVEPEISVNIIPQISGKIIEVTAKMKEGVKFQKDDLLFRIDPEEYILRVKNARAVMLQQEMLYLTEKRNSDIAKLEWEEFAIHNPDEKADSLTLREPQLKLAEANFESAKASLELAELNLKRTEIRAPFSGVVMTQQTHIGQYVGPGTVMAQILGLDKAIVVVPVKNDELKWLQNGFTSNVLISAEYGGIEHTWAGKLIRKEASLDMKSRMTNLVIEIDDPQNVQNPLPFGLFVTVEIDGKKFQEVYKIPRHLVRTDNIVLTVSENKVVFNTVNVLKYYNDFALIDTGLPQEAILITGRLDIATPGMKVRIADNKTAEIQSENFDNTKDN